MQAQLIHRYTENKIYGKHRLRYEYWTIIQHGKAYTFVIEHDFKQDPFLKFGDNYLPDELRNQFYGMIDDIFNAEPHVFLAKVLENYSLSER